MTFADIVLRDGKHYTGSYYVLLKPATFLGTVYFM